MLEGFILKVELNLVTVLTVGVVLVQLNKTEVNLDGAFWDGLGLVGLGELDLVEEDAGDFANEKDLVNVDLGPLVDDVFDNIKTFLLSHFITIFLTTYIFTYF